MTPDEVSKKFPNYELQWIAESHGAAAVPVQHPVKPDDFDVYASVSFCDNRLWAISRELDPDTDYLVYSQDFLREYGQPTVKHQEGTFHGHERWRRHKARIGLGTAWHTQAPDVHPRRKNRIRQTPIPGKLL